jgi:hypothetical protein
LSQPMILPNTYPHLRSGIFKILAYLKGINNNIYHLYLQEKSNK